MVFQMIGDVDDVVLTGGGCFFKEDGVVSDNIRGGKGGTGRAG